MISPDDTLDSASVGFTLSSDIELNGDINRASQQGAKFALLMAMLEPNNLYRPHIEQSDSSRYSSSENPELYYYRRSPLEATEAYWQSSDNTASLIETGHIASAQLWLAMHPEPLSLHNNANKLDEEVLANASVFAQSRMNNKPTSDIKVDETGLYDILHELETTPA